ncbi:hypothetical protein D3C81_1196030 [compost metagenome]
MRGLQAHFIAHELQLARAHILDGETQALLALPADLAVLQAAAFINQALGQARHCPGAGLAFHVHHEFLLQRGAGFDQVPAYAPVLGQHHQPIGHLIQRHRHFQALEMAAQQVLLAGGVVAEVAGFFDQRQQATRAHASRLVQQEGRRFGTVGIGVVGQGHHFFGDHGLRGFHHHAIHADPAAFNVLLGLGTRALQLRGQALVETDGRGHGYGVLRRAGSVAPMSCCRERKAQRGSSSSAVRYRRISNSSWW